MFWGFSLALGFRVYGDVGFGVVVCTTDFWIFFVAGLYPKALWMLGHCNRSPQDLLSY